MTWNAALHPRAPKGAGGGQFISASSSTSGTGAVNKAAAGAKRKLGNLSAGRIRQYQKSNGLKVDGIIGHQTAEALLGNRNAHRLLTGVLTTKQKRALARL